MWRAREKYGHLVAQVTREKVKALAQLTDDDSLRLPSRTTIVELAMKGYTLDDVLATDSTLTLCTKGSRPFVLKSLDCKELESAQLFQATFPEGAPGLRPFTLHCCAAWRKTTDNA